MSFENEGDQNAHQFLEIKTENSEFQQNTNDWSNQEIKQENFDGEFFRFCHGDVPALSSNSLILIGNVFALPY